MLTAKMWALEEPLGSSRMRKKGLKSFKYCNLTGALLKVSHSHSFNPCNDHDITPFPGRKLKLREIESLVKGHTTLGSGVSALESRDESNIYYLRS